MRAGNITRIRALLLLAAAWCCIVAPALHAQRTKLARIDGTVTDSVRAVALPGALVLLARRTADTAVSRSTTTDAAGQFAFENLPPGDYVVALETAFLDSLDIAPPVQSVSLAPDERQSVSLAVPSGTALRSLACPGVILPPNTGALRGRVGDAITGQPLHGALVAVGWMETILERQSLRAANEPHGVEVRTDSLGRFLICGVPTETYLDLRASADSHKEVLLQIAVTEDAGVGRQDLSLTPEEGPTATLAALESSGSAPRDAASGATASLTGVIYGAVAPLSRVQVQRQGDSTAASTDSLGRYRLGTMSPGTQVLEIRKVGYLPLVIPLDIRPGQNSAPDVHLTRITTLDSIKVVAQRSLYREFETRARSYTYGRFLRADDIARKHPLLTSDLFRQMPGFKVIRDSRKTSDLDYEVIQSGGMTSWTHTDFCRPNIVVDGVPHQMINWIDPGSIGAMEIYPGVATGPIQYRSNCGTILIWTKR